MHELNKPDTEIYLFSDEENKECEFSKPSFINCSECYKITIPEDVDVLEIQKLLDTRKMDDKVVKSVNSKIKAMDEQNRLEIFEVSFLDFIKWNDKL
ncbi:hypothetical protein [Mycoplasma hafezii]|uniref:hypothetical protein n=1 Tax=Mycoplasma hafezii TaxID=525886 RepID=UPI003CEE7431